MNMVIRQRGAALVIGLILLLVLTLLAVAGMNTSSMELVMAGNEQFRQKAFRAAETGVERTIPRLASVGQSCQPKDVLDETVADTNNDGYKTTARYLGDGKPPMGYSEGEYGGIYYQIVSTGRSDRNANSVTTQGTVLPQYTGGVTVLTPCP
jgi:type IV pilus assembly protein PilX